ncbi:MAG: response regulator transcription factor [Ruminococcaceae bacterium]|nr:response regulator transcription factor [Oscillospiraceae bacterium]
MGECLNLKKIIVADDEARIRRLVCDFLKKEGYEPLEADDGDVALEIFQKNPDTALMIVDIMMPNMDGWTLCREIRKTSGVPIIMLTARSQEFDELMGFEAGADDYVTKPFSPAVLMKRVELLIRRTSNSSNSYKNCKTVGSLIIDEDAHEVFVDKQAVSLALKEYNILLKLASMPGRVFTREQLLDDIWGYDYVGDIRTVDSHVARLRTKLGEWGNRHLKTVYGTGYKIEVNE